MIYSFEPIDDCYQELVTRFKRDPRFKAYPWALGAQQGEGEFHKSEYSHSSSMLEMAEAHKRNFPYASSQSTRVVEIRRLDDVARDLRIERPLMVKLDVQGYEEQVIQGGLALLRSATVVISEVSFEALYVGQPLFDRIYDLLASLGFGYQGNWGQLTSPVDGHVLQADAIFCKS
jgi:FkbM family methyltransferase